MEESVHAILHFATIIREKEREKMRMCLRTLMDYLPTFVTTSQKPPSAHAPGPLHHMLPTALTHTNNKLSYWYTNAPAGPRRVCINIPIMLKKAAVVVDVPWVTILKTCTLLMLMARYFLNIKL